MTTITCKLPEKLSAQLEAVARRKRVSKSAIVRQALEQHLKRIGAGAAPTAFDLVRDLCGSLEGPSDLSHNPQYLEDLGA